VTIPGVAFIFAGGARIDVDKLFTDILTAEKTTAELNSEYYTRARTATLVEAFPAPTATSRDTDKLFTDIVGASRTTGKVDLIIPDNFQGIIDDTTCPGPPLTCDLTWDLGAATGFTMTLRRYDGGWTTITSSLAAGTEAYSDTASTATTTKYGIKLNISGASEIEANVDMLCPI